jgi:hypothetical protein
MKALIATIAFGLLQGVAFAQTVPPASPSPSAVVGAPTNTSMVFVPKGTVVVVQPTEGLSSYAAAPGEPVDYQVAQDVVVNGYVVAKTGDNASGLVLEAQQGKAGYYGIGYKAGDLRIAVKQVNNFCGDTLKVNFIRTEYRRRQGLFGANKDVQVAKGQKYAAIVAYPQKVCGAATTERNPAIGEDVLQSDQ